MTATVIASDGSPAVLTFPAELVGAGFFCPVAPRVRRGPLVAFGEVGASSSFASFLSACLGGLEEGNSTSKLCDSSAPDRGRGEEDRGGRGSTAAEEGRQR